ncbi:MAG: sugar ABC transporter permease [Lachnospiraceae bacterium]|nr:sugar ABC transporter permease [Lachnospiraceae bacterium]MBQ8245645.1 sugar ABC transporter permease [Lachnospiraceae bacterium]
MKKLQSEKLKKDLKSLWRDRELIIMSLPAVILVVMFKILPWSGLQLAFKKFSYAKGLFGSPWVGLNNFKFLFLSGDVFVRMTRNTVAYFVLFTAAGTIGAVALAIALNEMVFKRSAKMMQSVMIMPTFISYVAITFIVNALLDYQVGMINQAITSGGGKAIQFYMEAKYWPLILTIVHIWKNVGYSSVLYLSVLAGVDPEMYDAAAIDGANTFQKIRYVTIPMLIPMISIRTLMSLGNIMESDTGLFYRVTKNTGALYPTTQVLDSYVMNAIMNTGGNFSTTAAVTFYQSIIGFALTIIVNLIVRKKSPEHALF